MRVILSLAFASLIIAACSRDGGNTAPPRVDAPAVFPRQLSTIVVPVDAPLADLAAALDRELPRELWRIDQHKDRCVPGRRVAGVKVTPDLGCRIRGRVVRGPLRLSGRGERLRITMPVNAAITAENVGGVVTKTVTGAAIVHANARLSLDRNWTPGARVAIDYDWTVPPGIDILGQRIVFVEQADRRLAPVVAKLERTLPQELAKLRLRDQLNALWARGFVTLSLNRENPPAWMRVTPQRLGFGGYRIDGSRLHLLLAAEAVTETFVGPRPSDPRPTALPPLGRAVGERGLRFFVPVLADYRQLEPVMLRALRKLATQGIRLPGVGPVEAGFRRVTIYATANGRLAVGVDTEVRAPGSALLKTRGTVWLVALPYNMPGSQLVRVDDLALAGDTDSRIGDLLLGVFNNAAVLESIRTSLAHDFAPDYNRVLAKARAAIGSRQEGDFHLSADIREVKNGRLAVTGQGLFLPVEATGTAAIAYNPR